MDDYTFSALPWTVEPTDIAIHKTVVGYVLSQLTNVTAVVMSSGGQIPAAKAGEDALSVHYLLALQRYVGNAMWSMSRQKPAEWAEQGASLDKIAMHSEFLTDACWVATVMLHNARIGGYTRPADYVDEATWIAALEEFESGIRTRIREFEAAEEMALPST